MATRTVASGGGNFNVGSTWVGGVAPVANDDIIANSSSGNLTLTNNTVSLSGANFTGYTGVLAMGSLQLVFQNATGTGNGIIIIGSGMSISRVGGYFLLNSNGYTLTTNTKPLPIDVSNNITLTLTDTLNISFLQNGSRSAIIQGADVVYAPIGTPSTTLNQMSNFRVVAPYKWYYRPTGNLIFSSGAEIPADTTHVFDTTVTIQISSPIKFANNSILEFAQSASWTGVGAPTNKLCLNFQQASNATATFINTGNTALYALTIQPALNTTLTLNLPLQVRADYVIINNHNSSGTSTQTRGTVNILGAGGFTASNLWVQGSFTTAAASSSGQIFISANTTLKLGSEGTYYAGSLQVVGTEVSRPGIIQAFTASTTVNMHIGGGTSSFANAQIIDITNPRTPQYALSQNGNSLTRTSGFISSALSGGSFTYAN
jgi:hypothetical protein